MLDWELRKRWLYGIWVSLGLGLLAGAFETIWLTASLRLPMGLGHILVLGLVDALLMGGMGMVFGVLGGGVHLIRSGEALTSRYLAVQMGIAGGLLCAWYLWHGALIMLGDGRPIPAASMAVMPLAFSGVVYFNAGYWLRKVELGKEYKLPWNALAALGSLVLVAGAGGIYQLKDTGGHRALEGDESVLLITVDTLRWDHVSALSETAPPTPNIDRLAHSGVLFMDAVTPMPETTPAHASLLTGQHPITHEVVSNGHELSRGFPTLTEVLEEEGYATAAFVSSIAVDSTTGLEQGFLVFDDDLVGGVPGLTRVLLLQDIVKAWLVLGDPAATPWLFERGGRTTTDRYLAWLDQHQGLPSFAWIHYFEPHAPYEPHDGSAPEVDHRARMAQGEAATYTEAEREILRGYYRQEVMAVDALVGEVLDDLEARGLAKTTMVILASDHGENLGEHGLDFHHHGLYDTVVRVPLMMRIPSQRYVVETRVEHQVRLMDVAPTVLEYLELEGLGKTEGIELVSYALRLRRRPVWTPLVGRGGRSLSRGALGGLRNNGLKYIRDLRTGQEQLYELRTDPAELDDLSERRAQTTQQAYELVERELTIYGGLVEVEAEVGAGQAAMLEAMGYAQ